MDDFENQFSRQLAKLKSIGFFGPKLRTNITYFSNDSTPNETNEDGPAIHKSIINVNNIFAALFAIVFIMIIVNMIFFRVEIPRDTPNSEILSQSILGGLTGVLSFAFQLLNHLK